MSMIHEIVSALQQCARFYRHAAVPGTPSTLAPAPPKCRPGPTDREHFNVELFSTYKSTKRHLEGAMAIPWLNFS